MIDPERVDGWDDVADAGTLAGEGRRNQGCFKQEVEEE